VGTEGVSGSAIMEFYTTTKGIRLPVLTTTQMNAVAGPVQGLAIYNSTDNNIYRYMACFKSTIGASGLVTTTLICIY
jgi:hypothetical protein